MAMYVWLCMYCCVCMAMYVWLCMYCYVCIAVYVLLCMYGYEENGQESRPQDISRSCTPGKISNRSITVSFKTHPPSRIH